MAATGRTNCSIHAGRLTSALPRPVPTGHQGVAGATRAVVDVEHPRQQHQQPVWSRQQPAVQKQSFFPSLDEQLFPGGGGGGGRSDAGSELTSELASRSAAPSDESGANVSTTSEPATKWSIGVPSFSGVPPQPMIMDTATAKSSKRLVCMHSPVTWM